MSPFWNEDDFLRESEAFQLVYLFSDHVLTPKSQSLRLVDIKATFIKALSGAETDSFDIHRLEGSLDDNLIRLALDSGVYSRFKTDSRLNQGEYEKLYHLWIQKAWGKREIFCPLGGEGLVTVTVQDSLGKIGLLAVNPAFRGQGWGSKLVKSAEAHVLENGATHLQIPTQKSNIPACKLYESLGYLLEREEYVYHYWKE